jgi:hypothetical protein
MTTSDLTENLKLESSDATSLTEQATFRDKAVLMKRR